MHFLADIKVQNQDHKSLELGAEFNTTVTTQVKSVTTYNHNLYKITRVH